MNEEKDFEFFNLDDEEEEENSTLAIWFTDDDCIEENGAFVLSQDEDYEDCDDGCDYLEENAAGANLLTWMSAISFGEVPILGWIYLLYLSFAKTKEEFHNFARAWLIFRVGLFFIIIILLLTAVHILTPYAEWLLDYIEML